MAKRLYDAFFAGLGLVLLSPVLLLIAAAIKVADGGRVFFPQNRIGQHGIPFRIWKFRTMVADADKCGPAITSNGDPRVTPLGRILRATKLDELPQLWNVLRGEMSLVGPRPEVARYVEHYTPEQREILRLKPGITDLASLRFRDEESLMQSSENAELFYIEQCLPRKLELNQAYARQSGLLTDTWIILQTICPYWAGVLGVYGVILAAAFWCAGELAGNFGLSAASWRRLSGQMPIVVALQLICLLGSRHCKGLLGYFGLSELRQVALGLIQASLILLGLSLIAPSALPQRNVILTDLCTSLLLLNGFRLLLRLWRERMEAEQSPPASSQVRVGIIGAGSLGAQVARSLQTQKNFGRTAVAFFDDDFAKWQKHIHQIPVVGMPECLLQGWSEKLDEVAIALPNANPARLKQINDLFEKTKLKVYTVPWSLPAWGRPEPGAATSGA
jgi:lipopolysaccharide/colanic/teichoic acid biosynthesis glycosyltransferase